MFRYLCMFMHWY